MQRRIATALLLGMLTVLVVGVVAIPASAEITKGSCRGSATFPEKATDKTLDAARPRDQLFEAPPSATVGYVGDLGPGAAPSDDEVPFEGGVAIRFARQWWSVASWEGESTEVSDADSYTYDLPSIVPRGTGGLEVRAFHNHTGYPDCEAVVTVAISGDPGVAAIASTALAGLAGAGTLAAGRKKT